MSIYMHDESGQFADFFAIFDEAIEVRGALAFATEAGAGDVDSDSCSAVLVLLPLSCTGMGVGEDC